MNTLLKLNGYRMLERATVACDIKALCFEISRTFFSSRIISKTVITWSGLRALNKNSISRLQAYGSYWLSGLKKDNIWLPIS